MIPEILWNEVIDKGVDAAVEGGQAQGDDVQGVDVALASAFNEEVMHHEQKVTRSEADQVHSQDSDDEPDGPVPLLFRMFVHGRRSERSDHEHIGRRCEESRE